MLLLRIDGKDYPFPDFDTVTYRESNRIKRLTGMRMGDMAAAFDSGDTDVIIALAVVSISRTDGEDAVNLDALYDLPIGAIEVVAEPDPVEDEEDADADVLPLPEARPEPGTSSKKRRAGGSGDDASPSITAITA